MAEKKKLKKLAKKDRKQQQSDSTDFADQNADDDTAIAKGKRSLVKKANLWCH